MDAVAFHHPVHMGDEVSVYAKVTSVGRTSMKIAVEAWQRDATANDHEGDRSQFHLCRRGPERKTPARPKEVE